jgi:hypothetical protein
MHSAGVLRVMGGLVFSTVDMTLINGILEVTVRQDLRVDMANELRHSKGQSTVLCVCAPRL